MSDSIDNHDDDSPFPRPVTENATVVQFIDFVAESMVALTVHMEAHHVISQNPCLLGNVMMFVDDFKTAALAAGVATEDDFDQAGDLQRMRAEVEMAKAQARMDGRPGMGLDWNDLLKGGE